MFGTHDRLTSLEISSLKEVLDKANIEIIAIGIEELGFEEFAYKQFFRGRILIDTEATAFKILELKRLGNSGVHMDQICD